MVGMGRERRSATTGRKRATREPRRLRAAEGKGAELAQARSNPLEKKRPSATVTRAPQPPLSLPPPLEEEEDSERMRASAERMDAIKKEKTRREGESGPRPLQALSGQICQICGDDVGLTADGELFVACNECAFPICRICYEYERREGNQVCPQCKTRFKRLKGCARVSGDEEEDGVDDLENEFNFMGKDKQDNQLESMLQGHKLRPQSVWTQLKKRIFGSGC